MVSDTFKEILERERKMIPDMLDTIKMINSLDEPEYKLYKAFLDTIPAYRELQRQLAIDKQIRHGSGGDGKLSDTLRKKAIEIFGEDPMQSVARELALDPKYKDFNVFGNPNETFKVMVPLLAKKLFGNEDMVKALMEKYPMDNDLPVSLPTKTFDACVKDSNYDGKGIDYPSWIKKKEEKCKEEENYDWNKENKEETDI